MMRSKVTNRLKNTSLAKYISHSRQKLDQIDESLNRIERQNNEALDRIRRQNNELLFANIFRDSIRSSRWLIDKSFSPYRGAANYSLLYKLYKIYDIYRPENILEFGLGQSTKLTSYYAASNKKAEALVIDNSDEWIAIYKSQTLQTPNLKLEKLAVRDFKKG